jgi:hypothetical protein
MVFSLQSGHVTLLPCKNVRLPPRRGICGSGPSPCLFTTARILAILRQPLGAWLHKHCHLKRQWPALYSAGSYRRRPRIFLSVSRTVYLVCHQCPDSADFYATDQHTTAIPANSIPVDIVRANNIIQKRRTWPLIGSVDPNVVEGLAPWQRNLEPWQYALVNHTVATKTHRDSAFELLWACRRPEPPRSPSLWPVLVCDGSVQSDEGTLGWVLALSTGVVLSTGCWS